VVRCPQHGDRFRPLGSPGSRVLSDVLAERGVPAIERPYWPLVCDQSGIVWVVGHTIAERAKVTASSRSGLEVTATMHYAAE
jgi:tRNA(Ile)-lysidine synthase